MSSRPHHQPPVPTLTEIAELTAWCRRLSEQRHRVDPDELAAYQAAKTALLSRLTNQPDHHQAHPNRQEPS